AADADADAKNARANGQSNEDGFVGHGASRQQSLSIMHSLSARLHALFTLSGGSAAWTGLIIAFAARNQSLNVSRNPHGSFKTACEPCSDPRNRPEDEGRKRPRPCPCGSPKLDAEDGHKKNAPRQNLEALLFVQCDRSLSPG